MIDEPPYDRNGSGLPESGMILSTPHTLTNIWMMMSDVQPHAMSRPERSEAYLAMRNPAQAKTTKPAITPSVPTRPHSSPTTAKMKSLCAMGRYAYFCFEKPMPTPKSPPEPNA